MVHRAGLHRRCPRLSVVRYTTDSIRHPFLHTARGKLSCKYELRTAHPAGIRPQRSMLRFVPQGQVRTGVIADKPFSTDGCGSREAYRSFLREGLYERFCSSLQPVRPTLRGIMGHKRSRQPDRPTEKHLRKRAGSPDNSGYLQTETSRRPQITVFGTSQITRNTILRRIRDRRRGCVRSIRR